MVDRYVADATDLDPDGDYMLYDDYAALCEAVQRWAELRDDYRLSLSPETFDALERAEKHMLALANQ